MAPKDVLVSLLFQELLPKCGESVFTGTPNAGSPTVSSLPCLPREGCFSGGLGAAKPGCQQVCVESHIRS